jgi:subtilisin family serine protease
VLDQYGNGWYSDIAAGIVYAADSGARIINLSLGGASDSQTLRAAVDYARERGSIVVAATGNTGGAVLYPAAYEPVLAVAATDANDQHASFSNYGPQVDVAAPGVDIYSTWCHPDAISGLCLGNYYFTKSGTSMAAPHVSGVAALVWSRWPDLTADAVAMQITRTVVDVGSPGWDPYLGWGRLDAAAAVITLTTVSPDLWIHLSAPGQVWAGQAVVWQIQYGNRGGEAHNVWITATLPINSTGSFTYSAPLLAATSGPYTLTLTTTVGLDLLPGAEFTHTATIASAEADLNLLDNSTQVVTRVVRAIFLPLIWKG